MGWPNPKTRGELLHLADIASRTDIYGHTDPEPLEPWEIPCAVCEVVAVEREGGLCKACDYPGNYCADCLEAVSRCACEECD